MNDQGTKSPVAASPPEVEPFDATEGRPDLIHRAIDALKRQWKWALPLAIVLAAAAGTLAYFLAPVSYRSVATVRVRPLLPRVLYQTEQSGVMPLYDAYVESQVRMVSSRQVVSEALRNPIWSSLGRGSSPADVDAFTSRLGVSHPRATELIVLTFSDSSADVATRATRAVVEAYEKIHAENDGTVNTQKIQVLESRRASLQAEMKGLNERIGAIATEFGTTSLERLYDLKLADLNRLEADLQQVRVALAQVNEPSAQAAAAYGPAMLNAVPTEELAKTDPEVRNYLRQINQTRHRLQMLKLRLLPNHPEIVAAQAELDNYSRELEQYVDRSAPGLDAASPDDAAQIRQREKNLAGMVERSREQTLDLGRKRLQIDALRREIDEKQARLSETETRLEQLSVESGFMGRLSVMSYGETSSGDVAQTRKKAAAGGAAGGILLTLGIALYSGFTNRKCKSILDAQQTTRRIERLLGILPSLAEDLSDPAEAAAAAHYVHHIRVLLQLGIARSGPAAYAITSAVSGSGKTSLVQALGLSFASSGARTLLIDCDIIGGGLTRRMQAAIRRKLGQILLREGMITEQQLNIALQHAASAGIRVGDALVSDGFATRADVEHASSVQHQNVVGLMDVLSGEPLADCITGAGVKNLFILPLGSANEQHIAMLSPAGVRRVLDQARESFDVILVDSGPVPGSVEASMVAAEADQVIMVIARGELRDLAERALDYLLSLGASVAGVVFNRARDADIRSSGLTSQVSNVEVDPVSGSVGARRLSPVVQAVAQHVDAAGHNGEAR